MTALPQSRLWARWAVSLMCALLPALGAQAQSQSPTSPAATEAAAERSQRQSDNVYRWIKLHAEPARKPDPVRSRAKPETVAAPAPRAAASAVTAAPARAAVAEVAAAPAAPESAAASVPAAPAVDPGAVAREATPEPVVAAPEPEVDEELQVLQQTQPDIPRELRNVLSTAKVTLAFTVQPSGSVSDVSVVSSSHRRLNRPAQEAVAQWKFAPIRTARAVRVDLEFDLQ